MKLVIVEAPTKAKNLSQYLGSSYKVLPTNGHVRDLPAKNNSVKPEEDFSLVWAIPEKAERPLQSIKSAVKQADTLILATDLDREGEAISWHLLEYLKEQGLLRKDLAVQRVSFNAVTKEAVLEALKHPRKLDTHLIEAYLARLALDYLVGFTLSPVLWRKLPGSRSAGRVQSVALRIIVDREEEIRAFRSQEYWSIQGLFSPHADQPPFPAMLTHFQGKKLDKLAIATEATAKELVKTLRKHSYQVLSVEKKRTQRQPQAPFITSSLQQEAARKLGFSPSRTMQIAQKLYEGIDIQGQTIGLITYMRTDSTFIVPEFVEKSREYITQRWGNAYKPDKPRQYASPKRAQEAHEAIRPTDLQRDPQSLKGLLPTDLWGVYKLIWDRMVASQMTNALYDQTTILIGAEDHRFRATGSVMVFDGFLALYEEAAEEDTDEDKTLRLPLLHEKDVLLTTAITPHQHFTQPPGRYSEASLIKKLEELGIGRPSTYARILQVLQDRNYVRQEKKRLIPEERGQVVVAFLRKFFARYVDYHFTAALEEQLDTVSSGNQSWKALLQSFWQPFIETIKQSEELKIAEILTAIEGELMPANRHCPACQEGTLNLRIGKTGPFVSCSRYPDCTYTAGITSPEEPKKSADSLGTDPHSAEEVFLKKGPYGWYVQCADRRASLSTLFTPETVTLQDALWLLSLPKHLGLYPNTDQPIILGIGKFGPYVKYENRYFSVKKAAPELQALTIEDAVALINKAGDKPKRFSKKGSSS